MLVTHCARTVCVCVSSVVLLESVALFFRLRYCEDMLLHACMSGCPSQLLAAFVTHPALPFNAPIRFQPLVSGGDIDRDSGASGAYCLPWHMAREAYGPPAPRLTDLQRAPDAENSSVFHGVSLAFLTRSCL